MKIKVTTLLLYTLILFSKIIPTRRVFTLAIKGTKFETAAAINHNFTKINNLPIGSKVLAITSSEISLPIGKLNGIIRLGIKNNSKDIHLSIKLNAELPWLMD